MHNIRNALGESCNVNSDFSGKAILRNKDGDCLEISAAFLLLVVSDYVMRCKISKLEWSTPEQILGIKP